MMRKPLFIAEMSANHLGSMDMACSIVRAAAASGADAVKLQTFTPEKMVGNNNHIIQDGPWQGKRLLSLYEEAHTPRQWHDPLFNMIREHGMIPISSPFHPADVEFLESIGCEMYKIASFELNYTELLEAVANTGKPIIISTGMASFEDINRAISTILKIHSAADITILKCTSSYPASISDANLATMISIHNRTNCDVGISDHTLGSLVAVTATALGASVIEKHFTLSRSYGGLDSAFSMEPGEFYKMVKECEKIISAIGEVKYGSGLSESSSSAMRRSLWFSKDVARGTVITREHIKIARPANGIDPKYLDSIIGLPTIINVSKGDPVTMEAFQDEQ